MISFARDTITRLRAPLVADGYGTPASLRDWANASELDIPGCRVHPAGSSEVNAQGRETVAVALRAFAPAGADIAAGDRVEWEGATYEVEGDPQSWPSPTGGLAHLEFGMRKVAG